MAGAEGTGGELVPYPRGADCGGGPGHPGRSRVDRTALHHRHHLRPRGNSRAARHRHTETDINRRKKISYKLSIGSARLQLTAADVPRLLDKHRRRHIGCEGI